jgi:hypothetical protein
LLRAILEKSSYFLLLLVSFPRKHKSRSGRLQLTGNNKIAGEKGAQSKAAAAGWPWRPSQGTGPKSKVLGGQADYP